MFEKLRRPGRSPKEGRLKKLFSYLIFGTICLVFVFLAPMGTKLLGEGVFAYVGNEPIRSRELLFIEEHLKRQYQSLLEQADEERFSKIQKEIRQRALEYLIETSLLIQGSKKAGFTLSDKELRSEIRSIPIFQKEGRFLYSLYLQYLKAQNLNPSRFEKRIRNEKLAENWRATFKKASSSNKIEKEKNLQRYSYKINFRYVLLDVGSFEEENLEALVKSKNLIKINQFLKKKKIDWEKTGVFSLFSAFGVPIVQNQNLMEVLIQYLPFKGILPKLIRQDNKIYIVQVLSFKKENMNPKEQQLESFLTRNFALSIRLLDSWKNAQRQKIKIRYSDNI